MEGGNLRNKAFTLIELLAIIVILAIIAVITVPIILNVIDNAKRGSIIDSAYGYRDAIDKYYFTKLAEEDFELDGPYNISDGKLGDYDIPFTGIGPTSGTLIYEDSELKSGCLTFDDYKVSYDGSKFTSEKGVCEVTKEIEIPVARTIDGVDYYDTTWIGTNPIYYNPVTGESCNNYHEDNSKTGYNGVSPTDNQTSCLKWYAYSGQDGNVNLLLDHNTTAEVEWGLVTHTTNGPGTANNYLLSKLQSDTSVWSDEIKRNDSYSISRISNNPTIYGATVPISVAYTIDYSEYKARIITAQEIAYIVGFDSWDEKTSTNYFYFDSKESSASATCKSGDTSGCLYGWLYDRTSKTCETYGCLNNSDVTTRGYWTVSPTDFAPNAFTVNNDDRIYSQEVDIGFHGLRPVITVSKSVLSES